MADFVSVVVDGIPVSVDASNLGRVSALRLIAKMQDESADQFERVIASLDFCNVIFGEEQLENIMHSLDPEHSDPQGDELVAFVFKALKAASEAKAAELKN